MSVPEGWREEGAALVREFELDSFPAAIDPAGDQLTLPFDDRGYRDLLVPLVLERRLLRGI
jgi:hypothetical protein